MSHSTESTGWKDCKCASVHGYDRNILDVSQLICCFLKKTKAISEGGRCDERGPEHKQSDGRTGFTKNDPKRFICMLNWQTHIGKDGIDPSLHKAVGV